MKYLLLASAFAALVTTTSSETVPTAVQPGFALLAFDGAVPANHVDVTGPTVWTAVSGDTGPHSYTIGSASDDYAAFSIRWWEDSDDPCKFRLYKRHFNNGDVREPTRNFCDRSAGNEKTAIRSGQNEYITAIKVCRNNRQNASREKIKGIKVWGRTVNKNTATLGPQNGPHEARHTNCSVWRNKVSCPAGYVATKMKVYYKTYTSAQGYATDHGFARGISLGCRELVRG